MRRRNQGDDMIDDEDSDYLGLNDADEKAAKRPPGFISSPPMGDAELHVAEAMHLASLRDKQFIGATEPIFSIENEDGTETLPIDQALKWGAIMGWPREARLPTLGEVEQFQRARDNALYAAYWSRLRDAVIRDKENAEAAEAKRNAEIVKGFRR
jgi:hypothetical protein